MDDTLRDILDRIGTDNPPTNDELAEARATLAAAAREALEPGDDGQRDLESAEALTQAVRQIEAEQTARADAAAEQDARAAELLAELGADDDAEDSDTPDGDDADEDDGDAPADAPDEGDGDAPVDGDQPDTDDAAEEVPLAASLDTDGVRRAFQRAAARPPARRRAASDDTTPPAPDPGADVIVATAGPAHQAAAPSDMDGMGRVFHHFAGRVTRDRQTLVTLQREYPDDRKLTSDVTRNTRLLDAVTSPSAVGVDPATGTQALVAAGGICAPVPAQFDHPICGDRGRPIRDALPDFAATRGGIRFAPTATVNDLSGAVSVWTHETDQNPSDQTKPCPVVDCEPEEEVFVDAITACLTIGNFQAKFNPEFWASRLSLLDVAHDRLAEQTHWAQMVTLSTAVTFAAVDGNTVQTLFLAVDRAAAAIRDRHRLTNTRMRFVAPAWLRDALCASIVRQAGKAGGPIDDLIAVARARIDAYFAARMIDPTWSPDIQLFGAQSAGALLDWPSDQATWLLYPEGTFFFLDGGSIDFGTEITDSTLNATNDRQAFKETFEGVAFRGCESLAITTPVGEDCVCETVAA